FVGRRVALWVDERTGTLGGGALRLRLPLRTLAASAEADALAFEGDLYVDTHVALDGRRARVLAGARLYDAGLSDAYARARIELGSRASLLVEGAQKAGVAPIYDYVSGGEAGGL